VVNFFIIMPLQPFVWPWPLFKFHDHINNDGILGRGSARRKAATYIQDKTQTFMPPGGFETTTAVLEWATTLHALYCAVAITIPVGNGILIKWIRLPSHFSQLQPDRRTTEILVVDIQPQHEPHRKRFFHYCVLFVACETTWPHSCHLASLVG
jgi:hypothetical protein